MLQPRMWLPGQTLSVPRGPGGSRCAGPSGSECGKAWADWDERVLVARAAKGEGAPERGLWSQGARGGGPALVHASTRGGAQTLGGASRGGANPACEGTATWVPQAKSGHWSSPRDFSSPLGHTEPFLQTASLSLIPAHAEAASVTSLLTLHAAEAQGAGLGTVFTAEAELRKTGTVLGENLGLAQGHSAGRDSARVHYPCSARKKPLSAPRSIEVPTHTGSSRAVRALVPGADPQPPSSVRLDRDDAPRAPRRSPS